MKIVLMHLKMLLLMHLCWTVGDKKKVGETLQRHWDFKMLCTCYHLSHNKRLKSSIKAPIGALKMIRHGGKNRYLKQNEMNKFSRAAEIVQKKKGAQESLAWWIIYQQHQHPKFRSLDVQLKVLYFSRLFFLFW